MPLLIFFVLVVARAAHAPPDDEHPYGHERFESVGTIAMGIVFFTTAGILLYDSYHRLQEIEELPIPALGGIAIALLSILSKEWIYQYTIGVASRLNSSLLRANAWHSRSDAISSVAVLIGIVAAQMGYVWMDTVAAIFVALIIARMGWELCSDSLKELVDWAIPKRRRQQIESTILKTEGIVGISNFRSRLSGGKIILELRLLVNPRITVSEGHQLGEIVSKTLIGNFSDVGDVIVHIDPEDHSPRLDSQQSVSATAQTLPERSIVIENIRQQWQEILSDDDIENIDLHYLENGIEVNLTVKLDQLSAQCSSQLEQALKSFDYIAGLRVYCKLYETKIGNY